MMSLVVTQLWHFDRDVKKRHKVLEEIHMMTKMSLDDAHTLSREKLWPHQGLRLRPWYIYVYTTTTTTQYKLQNKCSFVCVHISKCLVVRGKTSPVQVAVVSSRMDASHVCTLDNALVGTRAQTLTRPCPCATCIGLLHPAPTSAQDGLDPLQLALVVFFLPSICAKTSLALAVGINGNLCWSCLSCAN